MKFVYRVSFLTYCQIMHEARKSGMKETEYVTKNFGLLGECVKVEIM